MVVEAKSWTHKLLMVRSPSWTLALSCHLAPGAVPAVSRANSSPGLARNWAHGLAQTSYSANIGFIDLHSLPSSRSSELGNLKLAGGGMEKGLILI